jgi:uncharacterized protein (DUF433 family)
MENMLGHGMYAMPEACRLTGLKYARLREWFFGQSHRQTSRLFHGDYPLVGGDFALSFHDLIDVYVAGQLREHGVSLKTVRLVYQKMQKNLGTKHPFCRRELLSDGKVVFTRSVNEWREELTEVLTNQGVFPQIILPFLKRIDYERVTDLARRWRIADQVVLDPGICFGKPIVEAVGIPTSVLASAYHANGKDAELVAEWFDVHSSHVIAAVAFEENLAA